MKLSVFERWSHLIGHNHDASVAGNTPYRSRPMTPSPETARDLAESPSVRMRVHSAECFPPKAR
ncbi:hypothetical protein F7725_024716 [Dissostichus mawsoni]|uniref:Uncharacterized protein n=1 Tax=Dissostichus mawsoni TaxID=36200 RepID=A0A7J5X957_DISMA|nr:hypothetical protein F7725_024716 [Dissostichus mawsoni]